MFGTIFHKGGFSILHFYNPKNFFPSYFKMMNYYSDQGELICFIFFMNRSKKKKSRKETGKFILRLSLVSDTEKIFHINFSEWKNVISRWECNF